MQRPFGPCFVCERRNRCEGEPKQRTPYASCFAYLDLDRSVQLLPDAGYPQEKRRRDFAKVGLNRSQAFGEVHYGTRCQRQVYRVNLFGHMAKRQIGNGRIGRRTAVDRVGSDRHCIDVPVGNHRSLRSSRRPGGEDHQRDIVLALPCEAVINPGWRLGGKGDSAGLNIGECRKAGNLVMAQAFRVDYDNLLEQGQPGTHLQNLVHLFLILAHHHGGIGCCEQILHLGSRRGRIHPYRDCADHACTELREHPFLAVLADDGDVSPFAQSERGKPKSELARVFLVLLPGEGLPDTEVLLTQRHFVGAFACPETQLVRQGGVRVKWHVQESHRFRRL